MKRNQLLAVLLATAIALGTVQLPVLAADTETVEAVESSSMEAAEETDVLIMDNFSSEDTKETAPVTESIEESAEEIMKEIASTEQTAEESLTEEKKYAKVGWVKIDDGWYYRNADGSYKTGWQKIGGKWYYFDDSGYMYNDGVCYIDGKPYNFTESGALTVGWYKDTEGYWYYSNSSGVIQTGWKKISGKWYYFASDDYFFYMYRGGKYEIDGEEYIFKRSGELVIGWYNDGNDMWYYADSSGRIARGWQKIKGSWYYLDPSSGQMYTGIVNIDGKKYAFNASGVWVNKANTWISDGYFYYYLDGNKRPVTGWKKISGKWYYFAPGSYIMYANSTDNINGKTYRFDKSGVCLNP